MYLFFIRHFNDYDHIAPIVWALIKNGEDPKKIKIIYTSYFGINEIKKNFRTNILKSNEIKIIFPSTYNRIDNFFINLINKKKYNNILIDLLVRKIGNLFYKLLYKNQNARNPIKKYCKKIIVNNKNSILIFDHVMNSLYKDLIKVSKENSCISVSVPHGLTTFNQRKKYIDEFRKQEHFLERFDRIVVSNDFHKKILIDEGLINNNIHILAPPRFDKRWINLMNENTKIKLLESKKIKVVFFVEKGIVFYGPLKQITTNSKFQEDIIKNLNGNPEVELLIKCNTRGLDNNQIFFLKNYESIIVNNDIESSALINWSDLVISGGASSIIFDAIVKDKNLICATYLHPEHNFIYSDYNYPYCIDNYEEFKKTIKYFVKNKTIHYSKKMQTNFLNDFIGIDENKFLSFYKFLTNLKK